MKKKSIKYLSTKIQYQLKTSWVYIQKIYRYLICAQYELQGNLARSVYMVYSNFRPLCLLFSRQFFIYSGYAQRFAASSSGWRHECDVSEEKNRRRRPKRLKSVDWTAKTGSYDLRGWQKVVSLIVYVCATHKISINLRVTVPRHRCINPGLVGSLQISV